MRLCRSSGWSVLFAASVVVVGVADAIVLDLTKAYFGSGYNSFALHGFGERAGFFAAAAILDVGLLAASWLAVLAAARLLRARPLVSIGAAALAGVAVPLAFDVAMNRLHRVLGDVLELRLMLDLAGGSWSAALAEASQDLPPAALLFASALGVLAALWAAARWAERKLPALRAIARPPTRHLASLAIVGVAGGAGLLAFTAASAPALHFGLAQKPAGRIGTWIADAASDFDRDGVGLISPPRDPAPLDAGIHPWAIEVAGNGIDEDGFAGDLPLEAVISDPDYPPLARDASRPRRDFVLILLESFRADVIGLRFRGREVTPNLNRLAREGVAAQAAYAHTPMTWASRAQLMQGRVYPLPNGSTLVEDFLALGYEAAWFSGQHDGVEAGAARLGTDAVSRFYDAREDVLQRTSRSAQPISLQVSWKTVNERVREFVTAREEPGRPLFLYVNIVDTHFPYWHRGLNDLLGTGVFLRERIQPANRDEVWGAYLNAAANVDLAVGQLLEMLRGALGREVAVLVTADHGQAFYEAGMLGHGQALDDAQSRVPLIAHGAPIAFAPLIGLAEVRGAIRASLEGAPTPRETRATSGVLQILGNLDRPTQVGLRDPAGITARATASAEVFRARADGERERLPVEAGDRALQAWASLRASAVAE
jgi:hypothetical protein